MLPDHTCVKFGFLACCLLNSVAKPRAPAQRYILNAKLKNSPIAQKTVPARCSAAVAVFFFKEKTCIPVFELNFDCHIAQVLGIAIL